MAKLKPGDKVVVFLVVYVLMLFAGRAIWVDPLVVDTSEHEPTPHERQTIEKIRQAALRIVENASKPDGLRKRDAHPAPHGCVQAHFQVDWSIKNEFRHGVLATPGKIYPAWIRFSNGLFSDDTKPDARGMAIKLMDVPGKKLLQGQEDEQTQDFVMINHHTFPISNVDEFLEFFEKQTKGDSFGYFVGWNPFEWHLREMRVGFGMLKPGPSPLAMSYFSMLPYRLDEPGNPKQNIKFSVMPCDPDIAERCEEWDPDKPRKRKDGHTLDEPDQPERTPHYLRDALVKALTPQADDPRSTVAARFAFRIQVQVPDANMPIEDASIEWSQASSPYVQVAQITIEHQRFSTDLQNELCENLSFMPWHTLPEHEPIGGLNRARRVLYPEVAKYRHRGNGAPLREPNGLCLRSEGGHPSAYPCPDLVAERGRP